MRLPKMSNPPESARIAGASWRTMRAADLAEAEALGSAFHVHHPESAEIAPERLRLAPEWCFALIDPAGGFAGYCVAHPWGGALPPGLDTRLGSLPAGPDRVHRHDVVLTEAARGHGHAERLLSLLLDRAAAAGLGRITLIAVGGAERYWSRRGFVPVLDPACQAFVRHSYGADGVPMARTLSPGA